MCHIVRYRLSLIMLTDNWEICHMSFINAFFISLAGPTMLGKKLIIFNLSKLSAPWLDPRVRL